MAEIKLHGGQVALVDDEDYPRLSQHKWYLHNAGYATRRDGRRNGKQYSRSMHREILGLGPGEACDHINGNPLDNRRCNLRLATASENIINKRPSRKNGSCEWRGVHFVTGNRYQKRWRARLVKEGRGYHGGHFESPRMAALAYNNLALEHFGPDFRFFNQVFASAA